VKLEQRKGLVYLDSKKDDKYEVLFKYLESLKNQRITLKEALEHLDS
jgi:hypothetical protein